MEDTICAISTSMGIGAISIVRVTGPEAINIVDSIFDHDLKNASSHTIHYGHIKYKEEKIKYKKLNNIIDKWENL